MKEHAVRRGLVHYSTRMYDRGWVANHDGNLSVRIHPDRVICTPTAMSKADVTLDDLLVVDGSGARIAGHRRPFSELSLHRAVYDARPKVGAVVHAHPPHATAFGAAGLTVPHPFLPEAVVSLGPEVPTVPLAAPGGPANEALASFVRRCDAVIIAGNGVLAWGPDLELAFLRLELVEHLCQIAAAAVPLGGVRPLPAEMVQTLLAKRAKGGLCAPDERRADPPAVVTSMASSAPRAGGAGAAGASGATVTHRAAAQALKALPNVDPALAARLAAEVAARMK